MEKEEIDRMSVILWDNDGVLVDTERLYFQATQDVLAEVSFELTMEDYIELLLVQARGVWHLLEGNGYSDGDIAAMKQQRDTLYGEYLASEPILIDGVRDVLEQLHGQFTMGIVTSSLRHHFEIIHARTGLLGYFDFVVANEDVSRSKPDPEPYVTALKRAGVEPNDAVAVEDSERGLRAARGAGVDCYIIPTKLTRQSNFEGALEVLENISEVADRIQARG